MVNFCCAYGCSATSDVYRDLIFHSFPNAEKLKEVRQKWIRALKRKHFTPSNSSKVCSSHFKASDYNSPVICGPPKLKKDAVPSIFNFPVHLSPKKICERLPLEINIPTIPDQIEEENNTQSSSVGECSTAERTYRSISTMTDLTGKQLCETLNNLRRDKKCLQQQLHRRNIQLSKRNLR